jgi:hypothetical protein
MIVIGGTRDVISLVDPKPLPESEAMIVFDFEASTWTNRSKNYSPSSEPAPWNLINASLFKLDSQNIGVLWYDIVTSGDLESASSRRVLRTSQFNFVSNTWRTLRVSTSEPIGLDWRIGQSDVIPVYNDSLIYAE